MTVGKISISILFHCNQRFGKEKDGNRNKFLGSNLIIFCYKKFEKFSLWKSFTQSKAAFIAYAEQSGHVKIDLS